MYREEKGFYRDYFVFIRVKNYPILISPGFKFSRHLFQNMFNTLNAELNYICYLVALLAHLFLHVSRIRVKPLTLRLLMSYIYDISSLRVIYASDYVITIILLDSQLLTLQILLFLFFLLLIFFSRFKRET